MNGSNATLAPTLEQVKSSARQTLAEVETNLYKLQNIEATLLKIQTQVRLQREIVNEKFSEVRAALASFEELNVKIADVTSKLSFASADTQDLMSQVVNELTGGKILHVDTDGQAPVTQDEGDSANERQ